MQILTRSKFVAGALASLLGLNVENSESPFIQSKSDPSLPNHEQQQQRPQIINRASTDFFENKLTNNIDGKLSTPLHRIPSTTLASVESSSRVELPIPERLRIAQFHTPPRDADGNYDEHFYDNNESIFGGILRGELPTAVLAETNNLLIFQDIHPKAPLHGLAIPKKRINSVLNLTPDDLELLYEMRSQAIEVVREYFPELEDQDYRLVFHVPPFYSVKHLHLHVFAPVSEMDPFYEQVKYTATNCRWSTNLDTVIERLEQGKEPVPYPILQYLYKMLA